MATCAEQVDVWEFDQACVAVVAAAEMRVDGGGVADALCLRQFEAFVRRFADDGVEDLEHKSGFNVIEALGS